jgi:aminobenzoyl-glutamate utilization protein A
MQVLNAAAQMYECALEVEIMGGAQGAKSDEPLVRYVEQLATAMGAFTLCPPEKSGGSEDYTYMMERVQQGGGLATNIIVGADLGGWGHHTSRFDIDERALSGAIKLLALATLSLAGGGLSDRPA